MADSPTRLAERLAQDGQRSVEFFWNLTAEQWEQPIYSDAIFWTAHQILAHFVSSEAANAEVVRNILVGGPGAPPGFDIDSFNQAEVARTVSFSNQELLHQYQLLRQDTTFLVNQMQPEDLNRIGRHPYFGDAPLEDILKLIYRHNQIHIRDIRRTLKI